MMTPHRQFVRKGYFAPLAWAQSSAFVLVWRHGNRATLGWFQHSAVARPPQITVLSRVPEALPIREFLIVGCQHGWLGRVGYVWWGFELAAIRGIGSAGLFWYEFCSIYHSVPAVPEWDTENSTSERTGSNG